MYLVHDLFMCNAEKVEAMMDEILYVAGDYEQAKKHKPKDAVLLPINVKISDKNKTVVYICFSSKITPSIACKLSNKMRYISRRKRTLEKAYAGCDGFRIIQVKTYGKFSLK